MSDRADKVLVERGLVKTRSQARMLIEKGDVLSNGIAVKKPNQQISKTDELSIKEGKVYVSRGAYKLEKALQEFNVNLENKIVADIGASTGGFTQVALQNNAKKVYAIDVGHDQLAKELEELPNVINMEGTNIKFPLELPELVDVCVVDLSFISITQVFKNIANLLRARGEACILIKPQFEAGKERLGKNGLVKEDDRPKILEEVLHWFKKNNYSIKKVIESPITGNKSGNIEYLAHFIKD